MRQQSDKGKYQMESLWNSCEVVNIIRVVAQWTVATAGIIALVFTMRSATLKNADDTEKAKRYSEEKVLLKEAIDSAHAEAKDAKQQASIKQAELEELRAGITATQKAIAPRSINASKLAERLRQHKGIVVDLSSIGDPDAQQLASELQKAFRLAGWQIGSLSMNTVRTILTDAGVTQQEGVVIEGSNSEARKTLRTALEQYGIACSDGFGTNPNSMLGIFVAAKPRKR